MTLDDPRAELDAIAKARRRLAREVEALDVREREAIEAAWRHGVTPTEIAIRVGRSTAHVRKLRPDDVPPARTGGFASEKLRARLKSE